MNYPPLGHAWLRFTNPAHAQITAVAIGLLGLLPWGALRRARAVGLSPGAQRSAVAGVFVLTAASAHLHWILNGFHHNDVFFGSWPAMISTVLSLHVAAWAAQCRSPALAGVVVGVAALFEPSRKRGVGGG